jgi:hypothetical protein
MNESSSLKASQYQFNTNIPDHYNETALRVLPCNPYKLFVFWDIPDDLRIASLKLLLRVTESSSSDRLSTTTKEIELLRNATSCYVEAPFPGLIYTIELGRILTDGSYASIRTLQQKTPPPAPSIQPEYTIYQTVNPHEEKSDSQQGPKPSPEKKLYRVLPLPYPDSDVNASSSWSGPSSP